MSKKKVVYLFGAGATQAVLKSCNPVNSLLTKDIQDQIKKKYTGRGMGGRIWNELISVGDIEHLISVLGTQHQNSATEKIRRYYRDSIIELAKPMSKNPDIKNLYSVLIDYYNLPSIDEELLCFMTLNYEDILERTIESLFHFKINYALHSNNKIQKIGKEIRVLKLHGSFNWQNTRPVSIKSMSVKNSNESLWIPPGIEKRKDDYPFNILWGQATEFLMQCDTLRVVGCSLSRNDWGLIPILYTVQQFNDSKKRMDIEIIDYPKTAIKIKENYGYLNFISITEIHEFLEFYKKKLKSAPVVELIKEINAKFEDVEKSNPFYEWIDAKIDYLVSNRKEIKTEKNIVHDFYYKLP